MTEETFLEAKALVFSQLEELDPNLHYHGRHHTFEDVLPAAERLCKEEGLNVQDSLIVRTAALFHDTGFLDQYDRNEACGAHRAKTYLPQFGYTPENIDKITECIMATEMPQRPGDNRLAQLVCDADLGHLGSEKFFLRSESLRLELVAVKGLDLAPHKWAKSNVRFLMEHEYFTDSAKKLFQAIKDMNVQENKIIAGIVE